MKVVFESNQTKIHCRQVINRYSVLNFFGFISKKSEIGTKFEVEYPAPFFRFLKFIYLIFFFTFIFIFTLTQTFFAQVNGVQPQYQAQYFAPQQNSGNYLRNSNTFRQEIARFQINVVREGKEPLPITQVPRVQKGDLLKIKLSDEQVGGLKLDQTQWNWTFLVAYINPLRKMADSENKISKEKSNPISEEIQFRKTGWYKEYSFTVPYDSQPVFFLYPKPKYRQQLMKVVNSRFEDLRKLGEKTIELADAYSKIDSFLNELQFVLNRNAQLYGFSYIPGQSNSVNGSTTNNPYNPYGTYTPTNPYSTYNPYNPYNPTNPTTPQKTDVPLFGLNTVPMLNQIVDGLARSFNINLPSCWGTNNYSNYLGNSGYGGMNSYGSSPYSSGYGGSTGGYYGGTGGYGGNNQVMDFINRAQCVAKNVNLQDFDISVTRMWQQGGVFLAAELQRKYPQIAYWINIAAAAIDFIVKAFQKAPLRIVPTVIQSSDGQGSYGNMGSGAYGNMGQGSYGNQYSSGSNSYSPNPSSPNSPYAQNPNQGKISVFADSQPSDGQFVTAYPIVVHKWQATPDPEVISLYPPVLAEPCLHAGSNLLKSIELSNQAPEDSYSRDFRLLVSSSTGFKREFPLRKNLGLGGWELNLTPEDLNQIPKFNVALEGELLGSRGFNEIRSPKFNLPISMGGTWELTPESNKNFTVGGKHTITLRNALGSCRCLQRVIYKPSIGGQFVFEAGNQTNSNGLQFAVDNKEVSFEIDTTGFQPGAGTIEVKTYGGESQQVGMNQFNPNGGNSVGGGNNLTLKLYPATPTITDIQARRGDREVLLTGERLEQIQTVSINGKRAIVKGRVGDTVTGGQGVNQNSYQNPNPYQSPNPNGFQAPNQNPIQPMNSYPNPNQGQVTAPPSPPVTVSQYRTIQPNQRIAVFEDSATRINSDNLTIELGLEDNRSFNYPKRFEVGISRPTIKANELNEIDGDFVKDESEQMRNELVIQNQMVIVNGTNRQRSKVEQKVKNQKLLTTNHQPQIDLANYPIVLNDKNKLSISVQNILTDYNFRLENISIETNIEKATLNPTDLPQVNFEVLDTNNLRINFSFNLSTIKALSGRRLQFRIKDRERGDSDWYVIKQTFVRIPQIESVKCTSKSSQSLPSQQSYGVEGINQSGNPAQNSVTLNSGNPGTLNSANSVNFLPCELKGEGLDYIAQISVDGGRSWNPQNGGQLPVQLTEDGKYKIMIPMLINQKFLQIKLRDFPNTEGLTVTGFVYSNLVKVLKNTNQPKVQVPNESPVGYPNKTTNQVNQSAYPIQNQQNTGKTNGSKKQKITKP